MGSSSALPAGVGQPPPLQIFTQINPRALKPHPRNSFIYGDDEDVTELVEMISQFGYIRPLVITTNCVIISGHQRWKAALKLDLESVLVETKEFPDELAELEALLLENATRFKNAEQKVREAEAWKEIEISRAKKRISQAGQKAAPGRPCEKGCENFRTLSQGRTVNHLAKRVGFGSGRTYEKAAKVVEVIDEDIKNGDLVTAQGLRKILNEKSVNAAYMLLDKTPQERQAIAELLVKGFAKSIKKAAEMINQDQQADSSKENSNDPSQPSLDGFSAGDWVEVNDKAQNRTYFGRRGRVEQILAASQQISVSFEGGFDKLRFEPHELSLLVKAPPPNPFQLGEIAFIDIDACEAASDQEKKWNGYWGKVTHIGEVGSLSVDVGSGSLQLFPRDLKPIDAQGTELRSVVERVLRLRRLELDDAEEGLLDLFQRREWLTPRQLDYLDFMEKFYLCSDSHKVEHQVVQFRGR